MVEVGGIELRKNPREMSTNFTECIYDMHSDVHIGSGPSRGLNHDPKQGSRPKAAEVAMATVVRIPLSPPVIVS